MSEVNEQIKKKLQKNRLMHGSILGAADTIAEKTSDSNDELEKAEFAAAAKRADAGYKKYDAPQRDKDKKGIDKESRKDVLEPKNSGFFDRTKHEPNIPGYKACRGDTIIGGKNNQSIVFGRDRPGGFNSGYGPGKGQFQAGAIDMVVGRMSPHPRSKRKDGSPLNIGPIFNSEIYDGKEVCDAARIYMSQRTDMDSNFNLHAGRIGRHTDRSAICMKADGIRVIARDSGIKLVTQSHRLINSKGFTSTRQSPGIDIIAGNRGEELQPMVLGDNLVKCLRDYGKAMDMIIGTVTSLISNISALDTALALHMPAQSFPAGIPTFIDTKLTLASIGSLSQLTSLDTFSVFSQKFKLQNMEKQYLLSGGNSAILSSYNNVN